MYHWIAFILHNIRSYLGFLREESRILFCLTYLLKILVKVSLPNIYYVLIKWSFWKECFDDCLLLQSILRHVKGRNEKDKLLINYIKCNVIYFSSRVKPILFDIIIGNITISWTITFMDLGALFDKNEFQLSFLFYYSGVFKNAWIYY